MKSLVKKKSEKGLWLEDVPYPTVGINDVLVTPLSPLSDLLNNVLRDTQQKANS